MGMDRFPHVMQVIRGCYFCQFLQDYYWFQMVLTVPRVASDLDSRPVSGYGVTFFRGNHHGLAKATYER